jgi:cell division protease FtsH
VEIPQAIRDRVAGNGNGTSPDSDSDAGAVLTPPGAGGDIHGGPVVPGASAPEPPAPV